MREALQENIIKNVLIVVVLIFCYESIDTFLANTALANDPPLAGDLLVAVSILAVTACFGNFAFTYEKIDIKNGTHRLIAHTTTGLLMLLIGISLEMVAVLSRFLIGNFYFFDVSLLILYTASVLYDFWDLERNGLQK
jgi:hypothetical protein